MAWQKSTSTLGVKMDSAKRATSAYDVDFPDWDNLFLLEDDGTSATQPDGFSIARSFHGMWRQ